MSLGWHYLRSSRSAPRELDAIASKNFDPTVLSRSLVRRVLGTMGTGPLSSLENAELRRRLGQEFCQELASLTKERDPEIFWEAWSVFAARQEQAGQIATAASVYAALADRQASLGAPDRLQTRAQERLDAILGAGASFGARAEFLTRNLVREAAEPSMLLGMGAAATVSSFIRLGVLSRLAASPTAGFFTRGAGARLLASSSAFIPEVAAFWGTSRAVHGVLSPGSQVWDLSNVGREFAALGLSLGLLKFGAWSMRGFFNGVYGMEALSGRAVHVPAVTRWSQSVTEQIGMFAGIGLAHYLEPALGLRERRDNFWGESLATLLQFNIAGRLSTTFLGAGHAARLREMDLRTQSLEAAFHTDWTAVFGGARRPAFAGGVTASGKFSMTPPRQRTESGPQQEMVLMNSLPEGNGGVPESGPRVISKGKGVPEGFRYFARLGIEKRITEVDPDYFDPENLGSLLSQQKVFESSETAKVGAAEQMQVELEIREYLNEGGLSSYQLRHERVQRYIRQIWQNRVDRREFSPRFWNTLHQIQEARRTLKEMVFRDGQNFSASPFRTASNLSGVLGTEIFYLGDFGRPTGSFKERGALVEVRRVASEGVLHVVTASHGNHGLAVAMAANKLGLRSTIVVPDTTPQVKIDRLRGLGATVVTTGQEPWRGYEEARDWALRYTFERNLFLERTLEAKGVLRYIHGFEDVIPGQGVAAFEILHGIKGLPRALREKLLRGVFLIPTGGGGLAAGVATVLRHQAPEAKVISVVSEEAPAMHVSLIDGRRSEVFLNERGLCDSGIGLTIPGAKPFELLQEVSDGSMAVSDPLVGEAMRLMHRHEGLVVEGGAATGVAAILSGRLREFGVAPHTPIVTILTGGNIDPVRHEAVLYGREAYLPGGVLDPKK